MVFFDDFSGFFTLGDFFLASSRSFSGVYNHPDPIWGLIAVPKIFNAWKMSFLLRPLAYVRGDVGFREGSGRKKTTQLQT